MRCPLHTLCAGLVFWGFCGDTASRARPPDAAATRSELSWHGDYGRALEAAGQKGRMLLIYFYQPGGSELCRRFETQSLADPQIVEKLGNCVRLRLPVNATIRTGGQQVVLLEHAAFEAMGGRPGVAILDFAHKESDAYGCVVGGFPLVEGRRLTAAELAVVGEAAPASTLPAETGSLDFTPQTEEQPAAAGPEPLGWHTDYAEAVEVAEREGKLLLICFHLPGGSEVCEKFASEVLSAGEVVEKLGGFVRARLPVDAPVRIEGRRTLLLKHPAFAEMLGRPGVAIVDYAHKEAAYYGHVVSTFPFMRGRPYSRREVLAMLGLPPGTLTQRTLIYAVRTHPDNPASTDGQLEPYLVQEASLQSEHQARINRQGHHNWEHRFRRINAQLPSGLLACEVCAESWPGEDLVEAAIECVRCWRLSSGHWSAVRARHPVYGYDMKRGSNGIWYATGIFGRR